jgi:predicted TIM-barrel fold metal-dependent hydrolase
LNRIMSAHAARHFLLFLLLFLASGCQAPREAAFQKVPAYEEIHKIDVHAHLFENLPQLAAMLRSNNVSIVNVCNRGRDGHLAAMHRIALDMFRSHPDLFPFASCFDLTRIEEPGYTNEVIAWLDRTFRDGAVMTKLWKEVGLELRRRDGSFVLPDDPVFDPIYDFLAQRRKPLIAHLADPIDGWRPLDPNSPHYGYFRNNPQFHLYGKPGYPSHADLIAARDRILEKHPRLIVIGAHLGSLEHDLDQLAERLDRYPNFYVDCAARTRDLSRLPPERVRKFFQKYQDRILYGVDMTWKPFLRDSPPTDQQRASFIKQLEGRYRADYAFYAGSGPIQYNSQTVEALALPARILHKFYHENAARLGLDRHKSAGKTALSKVKKPRRARGRTLIQILVTRLVCG